VISAVSGGAIAGAISAQDSGAHFIKGEEMLLNIRRKDITGINHTIFIKRRSCGISFSRSAITD